MNIQSFLNKIHASYKVVGDRDNYDPEYESRYKKDNENDMDDDEYEGESDEDQLAEAFESAKKGDTADLEDWLANRNIMDVNFVKDYSGRAMYGSKSKVAFTTETRPNSKFGKMLLIHFSTDNMGKYDYVYYTKY